MGGVNDPRIQGRDSSRHQRNLAARPNGEMPVVIHGESGIPRFESRRQWNKACSFQEAADHPASRTVQRMALLLRSRSTNPLLNGAVLHAI